MKKALLVVSFGTSHQDTLEKNIARIEADLELALPERKLFRAFTSGMIVHKLEQRDHLHIDNVSQALARMVKEGYTDVLIQPTHILNGTEYDKLMAQARPLATQFHHFAIGKPLLTGVEDYQLAADAVMKEISPPGEDEALVFMGHGTEHVANAAYALLEYVLHDKGWKRTFLGTVEGYPTLDEVMNRLKEHSQVRRVRLHPFMVVAGDHAKNDMAGGEDSWCTRLTQAGYEVRCELKGLGEYPAFRALFVDHARRAEEEEQ